MTRYFLRLAGWDKWILILAFLGGASLVTTPLGLWFILKKPVNYPSTTRQLKCPKTKKPPEKRRVLKEGIFDW
jgi:hypothetical protein